MVQIPTFLRSAALLIYKPVKMGKIDCLLGKGFKVSKFKTLTSNTIRRIAYLEKQHKVRCFQAHADVVQLLRLGQQEPALLRVEHAIKEQNMVDAYAMIEYYCHLLTERIVLMEKNKECPDELKEAISSLVFAASRCGELPELQNLRRLLVSRFGKEFAKRAVELRVNCGVNPKIAKKLSTRKPSLDSKMKALCEIASVNDIKVQKEEKASTSMEEEVMDKKQKLLNFLEPAKSSDSEPQGSGQDVLENLKHGKKVSETMRPRKTYRDAEAAAQAAYKFAADAAAAARAAIKLSQQKDKTADAQATSLPQGDDFHLDESLISELRIDEGAANFKTSKFKTLAKLAISRIAILKNQRQILCSHAKSDVIQLLNLGHQERALLRVEHVIKDQDMVDALAMMEDYCHFLIGRVVLLKAARECPEELKEAISGLIFASSRCGEFPELQEIRGLIRSRFGKEFCDRAIELRNNCHVNPKIIQKLSARQPSLERRLKVLEDTATSNGITLYLVEDDPERLDVSQKQQEESKESAMVELGDADPRGGTDVLHGEIDPEEWSESLRARRKYRDVADAAQEAFESAAYAAAAARAAVKLSRSESNDNDHNDHSGSSHKKETVYDSDGSEEMNELAADQVAPYRIDKNIEKYDQDEDGT
ncbi:hypothetical protein Tsubulata_046708, partial [Turnera subulata]